MKRYIPDTPSERRSDARQWAHSLKGEPTRWDHPHGDMNHVTRTWPDVTFMMTGADDDYNNQWVAHYRKGKSLIKYRPPWHPSPPNWNDQQPQQP